MLLRDGTVDDAAAIARVRIDTWRDAYRGIVPSDYLSSLSYEQGANRMRERLGECGESGKFFVVAEIPSGEVVGFASGGPGRTGDQVYKGEVYAIYILPEYQRLGLGRQLMAVSAARLRLSGFDSLLVWVLNANPNHLFYERLGGVSVRERRIEIGGIFLPEAGYGWLDLSELAAKQR